MKTFKPILFGSAAALVLLLPVIWIVAGLAADLHALHPLAGWMLWVMAAIAIAILLMPIVGMFRLPRLPDPRIWGDNNSKLEDRQYQQMADVLIRSADQDDAHLAKLKRIRDQSPGDLKALVIETIGKRKSAAVEMRGGYIRQAVFASILSPHNRLDHFLLLWINMQQIYRLAKHYGFRPSPRGLYRLYLKVFGAALVIETVDEIAAQGMAELAHRIAGGIPFVREAATVAFDGVKAGIYTGYIGLLTEYLMQNEFALPERDERISLRKEALKTALAVIKKSDSENNGGEILPQVGLQLQR